MTISLFLLVMRPEERYDLTMERRNVKKHHSRRSSRMLVSHLSYQDSDVRRIQKPKTTITVVEDSDDRRTIRKRKRTRTRTRTATTIDDLPKSLVLEILHRLDFKSAMRCRSVSKEWCSVVSDPSFARYFVNRSIVDHHHCPFTLLLQYHAPWAKNKNNLLPLEEEPYFKSLPYVPPIYQQYRDISIRASCHDLLLCCAVVAGFDTAGDYYVVNPITGQWNALPPLPDHYTYIDSEWPRVGLICNYGTLHHKQQQQQLSFRVMFIPEFEYIPTEFKVQIFSSDTSKWRAYMVLCPAPHRFVSPFFSLQAVPCNGLLFWYGEDFLVGLDPYNSGCCRCFQMPLEWNPRFGYFHPLGLCNGALRISQLSYFTYDNFTYDVLSVWDLNNCDEDEGGEGGKWCLQHQLCLNEMVSEKSPWLTNVVKKNPSDLVILACHPNERDIFYLRINSKVVSCNLRRNTLEVVRDLPDDCPHALFNVFDFVLPCWPTPIHSSPFLL